MLTETFANNAQTTLNGPITSTDTTFVVTDASAFPTSGNFRIVVDLEIMLVLYVSSNVFYVVRGRENTTAADHVSSSIVTQVLTVGALGAFARLDQPNDSRYVNGPNQLAQLDNDGLLTRDATSDLRNLIRLLLLTLSEEGLELPGELAEELDDFMNGE